MHFKKIILLWFLYLSDVLTKVRTEQAATFNAYKDLDFTINEMKPKKSANNKTLQYPFSCEDAISDTNKAGAYLIRIPDSELLPFYVYCMPDPKNGPAWTLIQRRNSAQISFDRSWADYSAGFGHIESDFWLGLKRIHALTTAVKHEIWIELQDWTNDTRSAKYSTFGIGDAEQGYVLNVLGEYTGDAGNSLKWHAGMKFHTIDQDVYDCAKFYHGGWWFDHCYHCFLNGIYVNKENATKQKGITWKYFHKDYSLKYSHMAIRPTEKP